MEHRTALALVMGAVLLGGCGHVSSSKGIGLAQKGLRVVAIDADIKAKTWAEQVDARIAYCVRQGARTKAERDRCMGVFGDGEGWEDDFDALRQAYDLAADALEQLSDAAARLEARIRGRKVDPR